MGVPLRQAPSTWTDRRRLGSVLLALLTSGWILSDLVAVQDEEVRADWPETLEGVKNVREVSGMLNKQGLPVRSGVLVRSGTLSKASEQDVKLMHDYGLKKIIDIRTWQEIQVDGMAPAPFGRKPYLLRMRTDVQEYTRNHTVLYPRLWNENKHVIKGLVELLADPENQPLMVQGHLGLDRPGILVAALLELAEVPREAIFADFMKFPGRTPPRFALQKVMDLWDAHEGGLEGWLMHNSGVHPLTIDAYRHTMFSSEPYSKPKDQLAAEKLFAKARAEAIKGKYAKAIKGYEKVFEKYPKTPSGMHAALRTQPNAFLCWDTMVHDGDQANRIDIVLMGEGYMLDHMDEFDDTVENVPPFFEDHSIFGEYYDYHNIVRTALRSEEDGVDELGEDTYSTILGGRDSGAKQGQVTVDHDLVMRHLEEIPEHDRYAVVFAKKGKGGTGGGGVATVGGTSFATLIHEWGHAFGGLMDEYTTDVGYRGPVNTGPNVSPSPNPDQVSWRHWLHAGHEGVGIHEGAAGRTKGAWKPTLSCAMASGTEFCVVCREALVLKIYAAVDPIDACDPPHHISAEEDPFAELVPPLPAEPKMKFKVKVLRPRTHKLDVLWWVLPEAQVPPFPKGPTDGYLNGDRRDRGPLRVIENEANKRSKINKKGFHEFELDTRRMKPGMYRVICRVLDSTQLPGEEWPWVLQDIRGVLQSERGWWVEVSEK